MTDVTASEARATWSAAPDARCRRSGPGNFYPFFTRARVNGACVWEFGNMRNGKTFGGRASTATSTRARWGRS